MTRLSALLILWIVALPAVAAEPAEFRFSKPIDHGATEKDAIVAVVLDADVYAATRPGYPDLRVFDAQGKEVPYLVEKAVESQTRLVRDTCRSRVVSLREQDDGLEVVIELEDKEPAAHGLTIRTPLRNFERRVQVYGQEPSGDWKLLTGDGVVFDYSRYMDVSNNEVRLPKNTYRRFKINISGISDEQESPFLELTRKYRGDQQTERTERTVLERRPFRMDRIEPWGERNVTLRKVDRKTDYPVTVDRVEQDTEHKSTIVYVHTRQEPLGELAIVTPDRNFSRLASVEVPVQHDTRTDWVEIGRGTLRSVVFGNYRKQSLAVAFPEQRRREYRLVIRNEDNPPIQIDGVTAQGNVYQAVFLANAKQTYRLAYGSPDAKKPRYDVAAVLTPLRLEGHRPVEGQLGSQTANPAPPPPPSHTLRDILGNPILLGAVVVILVSLLAWALVRATMRINQMPKS